MDIKQMLSDTKYAVEANSFETSALYTNFVIGGRARDTSSWKQINLGTVATIGHIGSRPICISLFWNRIYGELVLFWDATSEVVDYKLIKDWLDSHLASGAKMRDSGNFHNIVDACYNSSLIRKTQEGSINV